MRKFIDNQKNEQPPPLPSPSTITTTLSNLPDTLNSFRHISNDINRPIIDLSSFVPFNFQYKSLEYTTNEPFYGFLGDVEDPWNLHIGNIQFESKRDCMMQELQ